MIRFVQFNLRSGSYCRKLLRPSTSAAAIGWRFESTNNPKNVKKIPLEENETLEEIKKFRQGEVYIWHSLGHRCINPELVTEEQWEHLYGLNVKHQRRRYIEHLFYRAEAKTANKALALEERKAKEGNHERVLSERKANPHIVYALGHNSLLGRVTKQHMNRWYNMKLYRAMLYGQKIVLDCSYERDMYDKEHSKVAKTLLRLYSENRKHKKPLDLHICGAQPNSAVIKNLSGRIPTLLNKGSPTSVHSQCFTELFPKERLVMLTPDSHDVLDYNFNDIYVIGGIVDLSRNVPLTLAKAKKLGIRTARLPLDDLRMASGDRKELPASSVAAFIRELQINKNINEVIDKCVYLYSKARKEREDREMKQKKRAKETATNKQKN